ncbi:MAG: putative DNA-invertase from lambdoid prophage Rac [Syntrophus sp. PtaB.Bin075]|nr:MAG: putative DNA-invertase from lambdoid prophage Rac [Syntrophus sp. PtaB.Bin075]
MEEKSEYGKGKAWAYLRVSTDRQDTDNQKLEILRVAEEKDLGAVRFVEETASGRKSWRERRTKEILDAMQPGDALIVAELSRLGRSMLEVMEILSQATDRGLRVYAAKGDWQLDGSLPSKIIASVLAMAAEIERELISQRTKAALATRKAAGVKLGRPTGPGSSKLDKHVDEINELIALGVPMTKIAARFGSSVPNLRIWAKKRRALTTAAQTGGTITPAE